MDWLEISAISVLKEEGDNLIRIAIVDDEKFIREHVKKLIEDKQAECLLDT